ncbi:MAG: hypothetical protein M1815_000361 [Lichina confinis]|nr:MAG: hypothetical protein M1815_000361 [Lichina confinis]
MHLSASNVVLVAMSVIGLVRATPTPTTKGKLVPRACQTIFPTFITKIDESSPDQPGNSNNSFFEVSYFPGVSRLDSVVQFEFIPPNAYGCQLEAYFPPGASVFELGDSLVDVYAVDRVSPVSTFSWNQAPRSTFLFGTINFESSPTEPVRRVINSFQCTEKVAFRFTISSTVNTGLVTFNNGPLFNGQGLRLVHNC